MAYLAIKQFNFDTDQAGLVRKLHIVELKELRRDVYDNCKLSKERMEHFHDKRIQRKSFEPDQQVKISMEWSILGKVCFSLW